MSEELKMTEEQYRRRLARFQPQQAMPPLSDHIVLHYNGDPGMRMSYNLTLALSLVPDHVLYKIMDQIGRELKRRRPSSA